MEEEETPKLTRTKSQVGFLRERFEGMSQPSAASAPIPPLLRRATHRQVPLKKDDEEDDQPKRLTRERSDLSRSEAVLKKVSPSNKGLTSSATLLPGLEDERRVVELNPRLSKRGTVELSVVIHSPQSSSGRSITIKGKGGEEEIILLNSEDEMEEAEEKKQPFDEKTILKKHLSLKKHNEAKRLFDKIDSLEIITEKKKRKKFDAEFLKFLKEAWKKGKKQDVSPTALNECFMEVCQTVVGASFQNRDRNFSDQMLELKEEEMARELLLTTQCSGLVLEPIYQNIFILIDAFNEFIEDKYSISPKAKKLYTALQILVKKDHLLKEEPTLAVKWGIPISTFIDRYRSLLSDKKYSNVIDLLHLPLSKKSKIRNEILFFLNGLASPTEGFRKKFFRKIYRIFRFNLQILNIPFIQHVCRGNEKMTTLINNISNYGVLRGIMIGERVLMNQITINGNLFYEVVRDGKPTSQEAFYTSFLKALYYDAKLEKNLPEGELKDHILIALTSIKSGLQGVMVKKKAPFLEVLKGCSNNSWSYTQDFMHLLYPGLFKDHFITNATKGYSVDINIEDPSKFTLITKKNYAVYRKIDDIIGVDRSHPIATITFSWALEYDGEYWNGALQICDKIKFTDEATKQDRDLIHQIVIHYTDIRRLPKDQPITPIIRDHTEFSQHILYEKMEV